MSARADITIDWNVSPRVMTVADPSVALLTQDLHDTARVLEQSERGMTEDSIINSAGKEDLGGGLFVGITTTLQDTVVGFAARGGPTFIRCTITEGNIVAVDTVPAAISPIETTAFTHIVLENSTSAALLDGGAGAPSAASIADAVWDELVADHTIIGSTSKDLKAAKQLSQLAFINTL